MALNDALGRLEMPVDITLESLVATLTQAAMAQGIRYTNNDLLEQGCKHNDPLFIIVWAMNKDIPMVLIDNGSALNIFPLRVASCLGIKTKDLTPFDQIVKAYDSTRHEVLRTTTMEIDIGPKL